MSSALWVAGDLWCSFILNSGLSLGFYRVRVSSSAFPGEISNPRRSDASLTLPVCLDALRWVSLQCLGTRHLAPAPAFFLQPIRTNPQDTSGHLFSTDTDFMQIKQRDRARRPSPALPSQSFHHGWGRGAADKGTAQHKPAGAEAAWASTACACAVLPGHSGPCFRAGTCSCPGSPAKTR